MTYDLAVIGGGINGAGIARDAAGRGMSVLLLEARDLAQGTSSASTKLIHGGLRYLEHYEFALVREALAERERLWRIAPHLVEPLRFILPQAPGMRPRWLLRLGLFLYDHIGGRKRLPATDTVDLSRHPAGAALLPRYRKAFAYSDCKADDARLVIANARDAADRGADVRTRCPVERLVRDGENWRMETPAGPFAACAVINAAGPWALEVLARSGEPARGAMRLVRGSHIVVPRLHEGDFACFLQLADGRICFAIPFARDFTLIGTTDRDQSGPLDRITASEEEIAYLCAAANGYFRRQIAPADVVWSFAGVRALVDDGSGKPEAATRGYAFDLSAPDAGAPLLTVLGGKITSYRHLAERALERLAPRLGAPLGPTWTANAPLPGGDFAIDGLPKLIDAFAARYPFLDAPRIARAYGTRAAAIFGDAQSLADCGRDFGHGLTEREVRYLMTDEWARTGDDVLWRRSKLGLRFAADEAAALDAWMIGEGR